MAGIGDAILSMMGVQDPRQRLLASAMGQGPGAGATPGGAAGAPGTGAPAAPQQPQAYQSPPDLLSLYTELTERSRRANNLDRGISMIAASFAHPENRAALLQNYGPQGTDEAGMMDTILAINEQQRSIAEKAAAVQRGQALAGQLGIDPETAAYLAETGALDELILQQNKPTAPKERRTQVVQGQDGRAVLIDLDTGEEIREVFGADGKPRRTQVVSGPGGAANLVDLDTGETINKVFKAAPTDDRTTNIKDYDHYRRQEIEAGRIPMPFEQWVKDTKGGVSVDVDLGDGMPKYDQAFIEAGDKDVREVSRPAAEAAVSTVGSIVQARSAFENGIITGSMLSPVELEGRKMLAQIFGIDDAATANTEQFNAALSDIIRNRISSLGTGNAISNADLTFMQKAVGAGGTISPDAIPRILQIMELGSYNQVLQHNAKVDAQIAARGDAISPQIRAGLESMKIPVPRITVPEEAIAQLKQMAQDSDKRTEVISQFDEIFGEGAAETLLLVP